MINIFVAYKKEYNVKHIMGQNEEVDHYYFFDHPIIFDKHYKQYHRMIAKGATFGIYFTYNKNTYMVVFQKNIPHNKIPKATQMIVDLDHLIFDLKPKKLFHKFIHSNARDLDQCLRQLDNIYHLEDFYDIYKAKGIVEKEDMIESSDVLDHVSKIN